MEAKLDRSGLFTSHKRKKHFITVGALVDLNQIPSMSNQVTVSNQKTFGCCCCTTEPLSVTVRVPRSGYAGGESIPITAEIDNLSNKVMNKSKAILFQRLVLKAGKTRIVNIPLKVNK